MTAAVLQARGLTVMRGHARVLDRVVLTVMPGQLLTLAGRNGAGKSTLLDALAGLHAPLSGEVLLEDRPLTSFSRAEVARRLACLGQSETPDGELTALEIALLGRSPHLGAWGLPSEADVELARVALQRTDALSLASRRMGTLSGGERQRVMLARALCQRGDVVLLDEPTHSLDPGHAFRIMEELRVEVARGAAVVVAVHDLALAAAFADQVAVLDGGTVKAHGSWREALTPSLLQEVFGLPMEMDEVRGQPVVVMGRSR